MRNSKHISVLFLDIGGVLLTNGWDDKMRRRAAEKFGLDFEEINSRHNSTMDTYEEGKLSLDDYLKLVVFHCKRPFTLKQFKEYIFSQSQPFPETIKLLKQVARSNKLRVIAISNEGRELTDYRIKKFKIAELIQFFIISCFVHIRKPDKEIYQIALDVTQVKPENALYIDDRKMLTEVAASMGINSIYHRDLQSTRKVLEQMKLI
jgi:putative hydrolase of the HAD superfamily